MWLPLHVVHESSCPEIGPACALSPVEPLLHDLELNAIEVRASAQVGLVEHLAVELRVPLRITATAITYRHLDGSVFPDAPDGDLHHRDETIVGPGDPWLLARTEWPLGPVRLGGHLGFTVPLGRTEHNPFTAGTAGEQHQHVQHGSGTVDPLLGLDAAVTLSPTFDLRLSLQARLTLYANDHGYQAGHNVEASVGAGATVEDFRGGLSLDLLHQAPERWDGVVQEDGNLGTTTLLLGLEGSVAAGPVSLGLSVKVPVYQHLVAGPEHGELSYPLILGFHVDGLIGAPAP